MAVHYTINAHVVDIASDSPTDKDSFLIDTNVWYWTTYSRPSLSNTPPTKNQLSNYPQYIAKAHGAKAKLLRCGLSLPELAHVIEKTEREIYNKANKLQLGTKEYRHNVPAERRRLAAEIQSAWAQIKLIARPADVIIDDVSTEAALHNFSTNSLDGYDLFMIEAIRKIGVTQVITDDGDYAGVPGMTIFTCNANVIALAEQEGKLVSR